ncbi:EpsG family protein [Providencia alcalifaciens]
MSKSLLSIISNLIFIINPFSWLLIGFAEVLNNKKEAYFKLSVVLGLIGFTIFPWGDGYERFLVFEKSQNFNLLGFIEYGIAQGDVFFYLAAFTLKYFDIDYQYMQFLFVFLGFLILFSSFQFLLKKIRVQERLIILLILLSVISLISLANNMRYMLATILSFYSIYLYEVKKNRTSFFVFFILGIATHFYSLILLSIYLLTYFHPKKKYAIQISVLFFISFSLVAPFIINFIATYLASGDTLASKKIASYLLGGDGLITKMVSSTPQLIHNIVLQLPLFTIAFYFIFNGDYKCKSTVFFILLFSISVSIIYFYSVYLRLSYFCLLYGIYLIAIKWNEIRTRKIFVYFVLIFSILFSLAQTIYFQRIILRDEIYLVNNETICVISKPLFMIDECIYSDSEIHLGNTEFRKLKEESRQRTLKVISN